MSGVAIAMALLALILATPAQAQTFSNADLEGVWNVFQLTAPTGALTGPDVSSYSGQVEFDANGLVVSASSAIAKNEGATPPAYLVSGNFSVSVGGVVTGTLILVNASPPGPNTTLEVREARMLTNRFTIVGASKLAGQVGLFTFAKQPDGQTFSVADIGGDSTRDWNFHELTPANSGTTSSDGAAWVNGLITFHGTDSNPGCSVADLVLSDGTIRAQRTDGDGITSFN